MSFSIHLATLYSLRNDHHIVDTIFACMDGRLQQNRLVVQMMFSQNNLDIESDMDLMIIMPEYSVNEIENWIQQIFGVNEVHSGMTSVRDDIVDMDNDYGIHEMLAKLTGKDISKDSDKESEKSSYTISTSYNCTSSNNNLKHVETSEHVPRPVSNPTKNESEKTKGKIRHAPSEQNDESDKEEKSMSKPFKPVKVVYKDRPKNLVCPECPYKTYHISNLTNHMRTHTGEKPYSCQHCGESFRFSGVRNLHERTHTGEKEYSCQYCGKEFARRYVCILHERTHTGEKPFGCDFCGKRFTRHTTKVNHEKSHVGDPGNNFAGIESQNKEADVYVDLL